MPTNSRRSSARSSFRVQHPRTERAPQILGGRTNDHVLDDRHVVEGPGDLERSSDAEPSQLVRHLLGDLGAFELHRSGVGPDHVVDEVERGGLAGTVRPDEGGDRPFLDVEAGIVDGLDAAEIPCSDFGPRASRPQSPSNRRPASKRTHEYNSRLSLALAYCVVIAGLKMGHRHLRRPIFVDHLFNRRPRTPASGRRGPPCPGIHRPGRRT